MARNRISLFALVNALIFAIVLAAAPADAQSIGFARMPSTVSQYFGCGYGAGHHAPIVYTPGQLPDRMDRHQRVPAYWGQMSPTAYAPIGCGSGGCCTTGTYTAKAPYGVDALPPTSNTAPGGRAPIPEPLPAPLPAVANPQAHRDNRPTWQPVR